MKLIVLLVALFFSNDPAEIAKANKLKKQAQELFASGDYESAITQYSYLIDTLNLNEDELYLNRAHSYFLINDTANAKTNYESIVASNSPKLKSIAYQQLGVMTKNQNLLDKSLLHLKSALKNDPTNEEARFDYEVVKRLAKEQQEQQKDEQNKDNKDQQDQKDQDKNEQEEQQDQENNQDEGEQNEEDQENEESQDQDQESQEEQEGEEGQEESEEQKEGEEQEQQQQNEESDEEGKESKEQPNPSTQQKLEDMNISEEKARMILEAMQNNEIQYIQQQRRKPTKAQDTGKPDW